MVNNNNNLGHNFWIHILLGSAIPSKAGSVRWNYWCSRSR